jgi:formylglycine-generating enzyme required for sulfatase activity
MVVVPAGPFLMGTTEDEARKLAQEHGYHESWLSGEVPERRVELPAFAIARYPVTNAQYRAFVEATGHRAPPYWRGREHPAAAPDKPATSVNRADALAYCRWAGVRLPSEAEWEKAARGEDGRVFPWGDEFDPDALNWNEDGSGELTIATTPVDAHPRGASPYGVMDLCGNVAEWCADSPGPGAAFIKGGSWKTAEVINLRAAARNMSGFDNNAMGFYGFRCAKDVD